MKAALCLAIALLWGCDLPLGPEVDSHNRRPLSPVPAEYAGWYVEVEECLGARGDFGAVEWFVADDMRDGSGRLVLGLWESPHDITIHRNALDYERTVKHEAVHHILQRGEELHGTETMERCAVIIR